MKASNEVMPDQRILLIKDLRSALRQAALLLAGKNGCSGAILSVSWNSHSFQCTIDPEMAITIERAIWCNWYSGDLREAGEMVNKLLAEGFDPNCRNQFVISVTPAS
ncbi:MAG: hypothetical protein COT24_02730 [Candidatus Kerfeldbacteria bacterium CG08_land_8_20_14_0_20_40_16]|uniref:Uncharacterized protein n=1 Tax=Candidatus Kerfeldbacteria bacterium CG08_land_8_20_14_0_20_40_16 TaxID=2014244 RepID=A0A2H0YVR7_9BACT|nr:MAG: hypothetical protein COT24_02730 [Candidatus Kerfeldbacteria bacterium CG08_land_8_20_14_0_20_40_16]